MAEVFFYKINIDGTIAKGNGTETPTGFIEYTVGEEPTELLDAMTIELSLKASSAIKTAIQTHLDDTAKLFKFETGMDRACSYAGYTNKFQADALILGEWRSNIWDYTEAEEQKVIDGLRTMPTVAEMMVELEQAFPTPVKA